MKSLGRTIDRILKEIPSLEPQLTPIKSKWKKYPNKTMGYWKDLISMLNETPLIEEKDRSKIKDILVSKPKTTKPLYTMDVVLPGDKIIGILPEHLSDRLKAHDVSSIRMAKMQVEANMTRNVNMLMGLSRKASKMEIDTKKIWFDIKDHFDLWKKNGNFSIKMQGNMLVLTEEISGQPHIVHNGEGSFFLKVDPEALKNMFRMLGMEPPPPGFLPEQ